MQADVPTLLTADLHLTQKLLIDPTACCVGLQLATQQLPVVGASKMQADVHMLLNSLTLNTRADA